MIKRNFKPYDDLITPQPFGHLPFQWRLLKFIAAPERGGEPPKAVDGFLEMPIKFDRPYGGLKCWLDQMPPLFRA